MKLNVLYITDLNKNEKPNIEFCDKLIEKYNLFLITQEDSLLKFWELERNEFKIVNTLEFIKELPNFKALNEYYDNYFFQKKIQLVFLRFEDNRLFRFTKNAQYILPISYAEKKEIPVCFGRTSQYLLDFMIKKSENNIDFNNGKGVIYTAVFGGYEEIFNPKFINENIDYICFTDDVNLKSDFWEIRVINDLNNIDNTRKARTLKILPHKYLKDYDFSIWVDAGFEICYDVEKFLNRYSTSAKVLSVKHTERDCIYDEAKVCIEAKLDDEDVINRQIKRYKSEDYPHNHGLIESGILYRQHNDSQVIKVMDDWYNEITNYSKRDQLSFNYVAWKNKLRFDYAYVLYGKNQFFEHYYHLRMKSYQKTIDLFRIFIIDTFDSEYLKKCIDKINEINENIPISIITKKEGYNFSNKNIELINLHSEKNEINLNKLKKYNEKYVFMIKTDKYINYKYFKLIYSKLKEENPYDAIIFEERNSLEKNKHSKFKNKTYNNEGVLFKLDYTANIDFSCILENNFIENIVSNTINKKMIIL